ncbi:MAG: hydroxymethylglutaryl-CoA reductase, degradative [Deltaproteobacteria bacterium]|nr:hydroxymethylglutaryl-CoA reductase, degradative [Deltaproteobacteria bacterium]
MNRKVNARLSGLYKHSVSERVEVVCQAASVSDETRQYLRNGGGLEPAVADAMSENVIASFGLPMSIATNFVVNGREYLVPMVVEEPSVVAAASNAARMVRGCGGFEGAATECVMTAQVQLDDVPNTDAALARIVSEKTAILAIGDASIPAMVARGGGCRDLEVRVLDAALGVLVVDLFVAVGDAMGANMVDTVAEAIAPTIHELVGGVMGLRILSNLPIRRMVTTRCTVSDEALGGRALAEGIARASRFASLDPYRAVTHNKGLMNGLDAAAVALGQDWRSIEAGAHAYASITGKYLPLSTWSRVEGGLVGTCTMPLAVGTVGGSTRSSAGVRAAFALLQVDGARELATVLSSVGLASNLAALRALAGDGIQKGHMQLHKRKETAIAQSIAASHGGGQPAALHDSRLEDRQ